MNPPTPAPLPPPPSSQDALRGTITVLLTLVGWSSVPLFIKWFTDDLDFWTQNGWRYGFSALIWLPLVLWLVARRRLPAGILRAAVVPSALNIIAQTVFCMGFYHIGPGLMTFGLRLQIAFVALGAFILFPAERAVIRSRVYLTGMTLVFCGSIGTLLLGNLVQGATPEGVALAVTSGLLFASYALSVRRFMARFPSVTSFAVISQYTAIVLVLMMLLVGRHSGADALSMPGGHFAFLLVSAVVGIALGHVFYYISINSLGVAVSAGVIQLQPFVVAAFSASLFNEHLSPLQWSCGGLAISGAFMMLWIQRRITRRQREALAFALPLAPAPPAR
ncbi:MAG: DMT family transporter [Planctomycetota bacterium]